MFESFLRGLLYGSIIFYNPDAARNRRANRVARAAKRQQVGNKIVNVVVWVVAFFILAGCIGEM